MLVCNDNVLEILTPSPLSRALWLSCCWEAQPHGIPASPPPGVPFRCITKLSQTYSMSAAIGATVSRNDTPCFKVCCFNQSVLTFVKEVTYIWIRFVFLTNLELCLVRSNGLEFGHISPSVCHFVALFTSPWLTFCQNFYSEEFKEERYIIV